MNTALDPWAYATHQCTPRGAPVILTRDGYFNFEDVADTEGTGIYTIAHALSLVNRFSGHTRVPYSVAEHSIRVSYECAPEHALCGLMHDATEAYLADVVRPAKALLPDYRHLEARVWAKLAPLYGLPFDIPDDVHRADAVLCATEARDLVHPTAWQDWGLPYPPQEERILYAMPWKMARQEFISRYWELTE